jgi:methylmalonyl-CoA mutase cobalamin-binding domain/chain
MRRLDLFARGHGDAVSRHPSGRGHGFDDHQFAGRRDLGDVPGRSRAAGRGLEDAFGTLQNDILKEYIAQKEYIYPPRPSMRLVTDTIEFGALHTPRFNPISISGYHIREAGSTAAQELAFTLRDGMEYVDWALERGLEIDQFAPRLSFFFNAHSDFFEEIAKYRARARSGRWRCATAMAPRASAA